MLHSRPLTCKHAQACAPYKCDASIVPGRGGQFAAAAARARDDGVAPAAAATADDDAVPRPSRRALLMGLGAGAALLAAGAPPPAAAGGLDRYIKKKRLDPLDSYVPLVLQAQAQLLALRGTIADAPAAAREALRSGAFSGLRDSARALGEYATQSGAAPDGGALVAAFFRRLEAFDLMLYRAAKGQAELDAPAAEAALQEAADALAALVATVPADALERARAVLARIQGGGGGSGGGSGSGSSAVEQSAEDIELLNELLTVWE